mgnify:CR=1 FL=1
MPPPPFSTITWLPEPRSEKHSHKSLTIDKIGMVQLEVSYVLAESHLSPRKMLAFQVA